MACSIRVNDIGTTFIFQIKDCENNAIDISAASIKEVIFQKPRGTTVTKTPEFNSTGVDGKLKYVSIEGDIDEPGIWRVQARVRLPTGTWSSSTDSFPVGRNLV